VDFGSGTTVRLHGKERVMTEAEGKAGGGGDGLSRKLDQLMGAMARRDRLLPLQIRDAVILAG
jgi:hypothetical protein